MLSIEIMDKIVVVISTVIIIVCSVGIIIAINFQRKQKNKYKECIRLINEKENGPLSIKNGMDIDDINQFDKNIDINELMLQLYDIYIKFITELNENNKNFDGILSGFIKEYYENKIDIYNNRGYFEITENIELINYSLLEYSKEKLKFRINITCLNYKKKNDIIISGSNLNKVELIYIMTYIKQKNKWLISNIEKVFEKKLGD